MAKVFSFLSGKGGVGKTTVVTNLGSLWASQGKRVLLVDGDWSLGKLSIALGVTPHWTIDEVLENRVSFKRAIQKVSNSLYLLASPTGILGFEELTSYQRTQLFYGLSSVMQDYDYVLLDHASGLQASVIEFAARSHFPVVIATIEPTSLTDAYAIIKILSKRFGLKHFMFLLSMISNQKHSEEIYQKFSDLVFKQLFINLKKVGSLGFESSVSKSICYKKPFIQMYPDNFLTKAFQTLGQCLEQQNKSNSLSFEEVVKKENLRQNYVNTVT